MTGIFKEPCKDGEADVCYAAAGAYLDVALRVVGDNGIPIESVGGALNLAVQAVVKLAAARMGQPGAAYPEAFAKVGAALAVVTLDAADHTARNALLDAFGTGYRLAAREIGDFAARGSQ